MVIGRGFDMIAARKKSAAWGTAVSVNNAGDQISVETASINQSINYIQDNSLTGKAYRQQSDRGAITVAGTMDAIMRYDGLDLDIAMTMGRASSPTKIAGTPPAYYNDYRLGDSLEGYMITMAIDKQVTIHEFDSLKYNGMTISGDAGDRLKVSFDLIGRAQLNSDSGSIVNTSLAAATDPLPREYILFEDVKFLMKSASDTAMAYGVDDVYPASFSVSVSNNLAGDLTSENDPYVDEPLRSDFGDISGTLTIPKYKDTNTENAFLNGTAMKLAIKCISSTQIVAPGDGPYYYEFNMYFPNIVITEANRDIGGPGNIPGTFNFMAERATTAPDGMDGVGGKEDSAESRSSVTDPCVIEVKNVQNVSPLA